MTSEALTWTEFNRPQIEPATGMRGWCGIKGCRQPQHDNLPLCEEHGWDVWLRYQERADHGDGPEAARRRRDDWLGEQDRIFNARMAQADARTARREAEKRERRTAAGMIYYLRLGDLVKIGFTTNFDKRMKNYPPNAEVLATHPGTLELEAHIHNQFKSYLAERKEWFRPHEELDKHIEQVRSQFRAA